MRDKTRLLRSRPALVVYFLTAFKLADMADTLGVMADWAKSLWNFFTDPSNDIYVLGLAVVALIGVVIWPDIKARTAPLVQRILPLSEEEVLSDRVVALEQFQRQVTTNIIEPLPGGGDMSRILQGVRNLKDQADRIQVALDQLIRQVANVDELTKNHSSRLVGLERSNNNLRRFVRYEEMDGDRGATVVDAISRATQTDKFEQLQTTIEELRTKVEELGDFIALPFREVRDEYSDLLAEGVAIRNYGHTHLPNIPLEEFTAREQRWRQGVLDLVDKISPEDLPNVRTLDEILPRRKFVVGTEEFWSTSLEIHAERLARLKSVWGKYCRKNGRDAKLPFSDIGNDQA